MIWKGNSTSVHLFGEVLVCVVKYSDRNIDEMFFSYLLIGGRRDLPQLKPCVVLGIIAMIKFLVTCVVFSMLPPHDPPSPIIMDSSIITDRHSRCFWSATVKYSPPPRQPFPPSHLWFEYYEQQIYVSRPYRVFFLHHFSESDIECDTVRTEMIQFWVKIGSFF